MLNSTLWLDFRQITLIPNGTFGTGAPGCASGQSSFYHPGLQSLQRRTEANQVLAADVTLARVESQAARQQVKARHRLTFCLPWVHRR